MRNAFKSILNFYSQLIFNLALALTGFWTTQPRCIKPGWWGLPQDLKLDCYFFLTACTCNKLIRANESMVLLCLPTINAYFICSDGRPVCLTFKFFLHIKAHEKQANNLSCWRTECPWTAVIWRVCQWPIGSIEDSFRWSQEIGTTTN